MRASCHLQQLISEEERRCPIVTVMDGHSHTLAFLGSVFSAPAIALGVDDFGQTGSRGELYDHYEISAGAIAKAARALMA
jgi:pyruvate dehydrogenase E1 component